MIALDDTWNAFHGLHGGLVVAWLLEGASESSASPPSSVTTHFLRGVEPSSVELESEVLHAGRRTSSVAVRLRQDGRLAAHAVVASGPTGATSWASDRDLSRVPAPEDVTEFAPPRAFVPFGQHVEIRPVDGVTPGSGGDEPRYEAWIRLRDEQVANELGGRGVAVVLLDAMPPGLLALWSAPRPVPTVELTAHFGPDVDEKSPWWHVVHRTAWASDVACVDETELRLPSGRLVAQARQHRLVL